MYLASKFEEIVPPELSEFVYITDDTYTQSQIVRMERMILKVLDFNLAAPTAHNFLLRYLKASEAESLSPGKLGQVVLSSSLAGSNDGTRMSQTIQYLSMVCRIMVVLILYFYMILPKCLLLFFSIFVSWPSKMLTPT